MSQRDSGQVLAFFALVLPIVLLPVAAYAVDAAVVSAGAAGLQAATAQAAETAAQRVSVGALRSSGALALDQADARVAAVEAMSEEEPGAQVESVLVSGTSVTVMTSETISVPFKLFGGSITLRSHASARLVAGYDSPSSLLPLPTRTF